VVLVPVETGCCTFRFVSRVSLIISIDVNMAEGVSSDEDLETFLSKLTFMA